MKILMLANRFHPHIGGVEKHLWELTTVLLSRGHEITIVTEQYDPALLAEEEVIIAGAPPVSVIRIAQSTLSNKLSRWTFFLKRRELIQHADLVHCHDVGVFIHWYFPHRFLFLRKPVYVTFHGWEGVYPPQRRIITLRKITEKLTCGNICIGDFICKWYRTKADYISYGGVVDDHSVGSSDGTGAVFIGRLALDAGIMMYLEALFHLKQKGINVPLTVCGDGPLREECEHFAEGNGLQVRFLGFVDNPGEQLTTASFVFVSGYLAILEAMSWKKLVFAVYNNPLKEDYLRMHPASPDKMFVAGSSLELARQLEQSVTEPALADTMKNKAYEWANQQSWSRVADIYEQLWSMQHVSIEFTGF